MTFVPGTYGVTNSWVMRPGGARRRCFRAAQSANHFHRNKRTSSCQRPSKANSRRGADRSLTFQRGAADGADREERCASNAIALV